MWRNWFCHKIERPEQQKYLNINPFMPLYHHTSHDPPLHQYIVIVINYHFLTEIIAPTTVRSSHTSPLLLHQFKLFTCTLQERLAYKQNDIK